MQTHNEEKTRAPRTRFRNNIDFNNLPPEAFLKISDVMVLTGMARSTVEGLVAAGEFPQPIRFGRLRLWTWGSIRDWLRLVAEGEDVL